MVQAIYLNLTPTNATTTLIPPLTQTERTPSRIEKTPSSQLPTKRKPSVKLTTSANELIDANGVGIGGDNNHVMPFEDDKSVVEPAIALSHIKQSSGHKPSMGANRSRDNTYHEEDYFDNSSVENGMYPQRDANGALVWSVMDEDTR